jgi:hypothetical protein
MFRFLLLVLILSSSIVANPYDFDWKTLKSTILSSHTLDIFELEPFVLNLKTFLGEDEAENFDLYIVDGLKYKKYCEQDMFTLMGFYKDSLIFYMLSTEERPYSKDDTISECLQKALFENDTVFIWQPVFKTSMQGGNIFWEGGLSAFGEYENEYHAILVSYGIKGILNPQHLQHACFFFDKAFLDFVMKDKMKIHKKQKERVHPTALFIKYIADEYAELQKKPEK